MPDDQIAQAAPQEIEAPAPETSAAEPYDQAMSEAYDRIMGRGDDDASEDAEDGGEGPARDEKGRFVAKNADDTEGEADAEAPAAEAAEEPPAPVSNGAPSYLPLDVRKEWDKIPEPARNAIAKAQLDLSTKLGEMGRRAQAFEPVAAAVIKAAQQFPEMSKQTPAQIAADVFELAHTRANLMRDPVGTMMQVAERMGVLDKMAARFNGQAPAAQPSAVTAEIAQLRQQNAQMQAQLQQMGNPDKVRQVVSQEMANREVLQVVQNFAAGREHWAAVEHLVPAFIPAAQQIASPGASNADVLQAAYEMAVDRSGLKATAAAVKTPAQPDPRRAESVIKARVTNINSRPGTGTPLSERDAMSLAWDRIMGK